MMYCSSATSSSTSDLLLEVARSGHEEVERLERLVVKELQRQPMSPRDRLIQRHRVRRMIDKVIGATQKLLGIYEEEANKEKATCLIINKEQEMMAGGGCVFVEFYDRLKEIRRNMRLDQHVMTTRRADHDDEELIDHDDQSSIRRRLIFSGEEAFGPCELG